MVKDRVIIGGPAGLIFPLPEGSHEVRVSAKGFESVTTVARVLIEATDPLDVELIAVR